MTNGTYSLPSKTHAVSNGKPNHDEDRKEIISALWRSGESDCPFVLSVLLRFRDSDYPFGIFRLFFENLRELECSVLVRPE